jgi:hypothetical protein
MTRAHAANCGPDPRGWIPPGYCAFPDVRPEEGARCVVLLKHGGGEWRGPRLAHFIDGTFEGLDAQGDAPDGWQVYAWRPANANDTARLPPPRRGDMQRPTRLR